MINRRRFLMALASIPFLGSFCSSLRVSAARNYFSELWVRPVINAAGTYTYLTGSLMPPAVIRAWEYAAQEFVRLHIGVCFFEASGSRLEKGVKTVCFWGRIVKITGRAGPEVVRE